MPIKHKKVSNTMVHGFQKKIMPKKNSKYMTTLLQNNKCIEKIKKKNQNKSKIEYKNLSIILKND